MRGVQIYIGDTEVVSNKNITIKEEMLATPSTILNNCYPKSWENDHDYYSRFFMPKDYTECLINRSTYAYTLPSAYQEVEYVESTGTQYIDTEVTGGFSIDMQFAYTGSYLLAVDTIFGNENSASPWLSTYVRCLRNGANVIQSSCLGNVGSTNLGALNTDKHSVSGDYYNTFTKCVYDDVVKVDEEITATYNTYSLYLFCTNSGGTAKNFSKARIYRTKIYADSTRKTMLKYLIPCYRISDNEIGFYDVVNSEFLTNSGTGTFLKGTNSLPEIETNLIFCGVIKNTGNILLRPTDPKYSSFQILDYKTLLSEGQTLDFVISNKTIPQAISQVVSAISDYGFVVGNIQITDTTSTIGAYSTLNKTPYDVFQYLAEISQSIWFTRVIDENSIAIDFYSPSLMTRADDIEYTQEYFEENNIIDIRYSYSTNDYRNKQIILSDSVYGSIDTTETIIANGYQTQFNSTQAIGTLKNIYVNDVAKTIATTEEKQIGLYADFYYTSGSTQIDTNDETYSAGTEIKIIYTPIVKGRQIVYNNEEISRINNQTGRNGTISRYETRNDVLSSDELSKVAQTYIKYKGIAEVTLTIETKDVDLFNIGEQTYFDIEELPDLAQDYMVKTKETQITQTGEDAVVFYKYTLSNSYNSDTAINYFDNQRRKATGNIGESEFITRNIDINNSANIIFNNLQITEIEITGDNTLNSVLNSPFIN